MLYNCQVMSALVSYRVAGFLLSLGETLSDQSHRYIGLTCHVFLTPLLQGLILMGVQPTQMRHPYPLLFLLVLWQRPASSSAMGERRQCGAMSRLEVWGSIAARLVVQVLYDRNELVSICLGACLRRFLQGFPCAMCK